jgi:pimeloyl-ACP methyl ester carboxylesterase
MATFLLIHGIPGSAATWAPVADRLRDQHTVLAPDLIGFNGDPLPDNPEMLLAHSQAHRLLSLLDRVGAGRVVVAGHDFGGPVAAHLLAAAPERVEALGLFATNAFPDTPIPFPLSMVTLPVIGPLAGGVLFSRPSLAMMVRRGVGQPRIRLAGDRYLGDRRRQDAIATIFSQSLRRLGELYGPVEAALATVTVPAVVGWGDRDPFFPIAVGKRTAALVPNARFRCYPGAGHFLPEERPADVAADLLALADVVDSHRR